MITHTYTVRPGFVIRGSVQDVAGRIEALKKRNATADEPEGDTTYAEIVEDARSPDSPLHGEFIWDDRSAAEKQRLNHARYLMKSYRIEIRRPDMEPITICPGNVTFIDENDRHRIISPVIAMANADAREQVLRHTRMQLAGMSERLERLEGLSPEIIATVGQLMRMIDAEIAAKARRVARKKARDKDKAKRSAAHRRVTLN